MSHIEDKKMDKNASGKNAGSVGVSEKRRSLIKGIGIATPLIMTVASRPVLGAQCTPSAWVSGNLSDNHTELSCGGRSPGYWKTRVRRWGGSGYNPGTCAEEISRSTCDNYKSDGTPFHKSGGSGGVFDGSNFGSKSMMQVLWLLGNEDSYQLGAHIVAALLNAASIPDYGMNQNQVIDMYRQLVTSGLYQPSVGDPMTAEDCVRFIQNTFD